MAEALLEAALESRLAAWPLEAVLESPLAEGLSAGGTEALLAVRLPSVALSTLEAALPSESADQQPPCRFAASA